MFYYLWTLADFQRNDQTFLESNTIKEKQKLNIILDLNGLLLHRYFSKSSMHQNIRCGKGWIALRPGCIEFLTLMVEKYNVGIWSTALRQNVEPLITALQGQSETRLSFLFVWCQEQCEVYSNGKIYRPDKLGVEAMFKPLAKLGNIFKCDARRTILIDDSPYKGSVNPQENCIYPPTFNSQENCIYPPTFNSS